LARPWAKICRAQDSTPLKSLKRRARHGFQHRDPDHHVERFGRRSGRGRGYGHPTVAGLAAVERAQVAGLKLEPVYTGKALALLLEQAPPGAKLVPGEELSAGAERPENEAVLFWNTNRGALPMPDPAWRERLPVSLAGRIPS